MNEHITDTIASTMIDASDADVEKLSIALIKKCAILIDSWGDSGRYTTFGERLEAHFGVTE